METCDLSSKCVPPRAFPIFINGSLILLIAQAKNHRLSLTSCFLSHTLYFLCQQIPSILPPIYVHFSPFSLLLHWSSHHYFLLGLLEQLIDYWSSVCTLPSPKPILSTTARVKGKNWFRSCYLCIQNPPVALHVTHSIVTMAYKVLYWLASVTVIMSSLLFFCL